MNNKIRTFRKIKHHNDRNGIMTDYKIYTKFHIEIPNLHLMNGIEKSLKNTLQK